MTKDKETVFIVVNNKNKTKMHLFTGNSERNVKEKALTFCKLFYGKSWMKAYRNFKNRASVEEIL